jgi:hypothetical protein
VSREPIPRAEGESSPRRHRHVRGSPHRPNGAAIGLHRPVPLILAAVLAAGCGDDETSVEPPQVEPPPIQLHAATARDRQIAADLRRYIERNYGAHRRPGPAREVVRPQDLPLRERRALEALSDNVAQVRPSIRRIAVDRKVITVATNLRPSREDRTTARVICTVIYGADVADTTPGHTVVGKGGRPLLDCRPGINPLEPSG